MLSLSKHEVNKISSAFMLSLLIPSLSRDEA
jgi:hypothetical protein